VNTKECKQCKQTKEENLFVISQKNEQTGTIYYKNICKDCQNANRRGKRKNKNTSKSSNINVEKNENHQNIVNKTVKKDTNFTDKEIEDIKELLKYKDSIIKKLSKEDFKESIEKYDSEEKVKMLLSIEINLKNNIEKTSKKLKVSKSNVVNLALEKYFENG